MLAADRRHDQRCLSREGVRGPSYFGAPLQGKGPWPGGPFAPSMPPNSVHSTTCQGPNIKKTILHLQNSHHPALSITIAAERCGSVHFPTSRNLPRNIGLPIPKQHLRAKNGRRPARISPSVGRPDGDQCKLAQTVSVRHPIFRVYEKQGR